MHPKTFRGAASLSGALATALLVAAPPSLAAPDLKGAGEITETVTVVSFDAATRHLVVKRPSGEAETIKVPAEARNAHNLKPGDRIKATYRLEAAFTISPRTAATPKDTQLLQGGRSGKGQLPGGHLSNHLVVTGAVLAVDQAAHTVKLVNPTGGEVHTIYVPSAEGRALLHKLKPGDKVTVELSESLLISTERG